MRTSRRQVWVFAPSHIPNFEPGFQFGLRKARAVLTYKGRPQLAMTAKSCRALHITLHRHEHPIEGHAALRQCLHDKTHHDFRTDNESGCARRIEVCAWNEGCDRPYGPMP